MDSNRFSTITHVSDFNTVLSFISKSVSSVCNCEAIVGVMPLYSQLLCKDIFITRNEFVSHIAIMSRGASKLI